MWKRLAAGGVVAAAAALALPAGAQVVLAPTVYASHDLPSNAITTFTVTCPRGYVAVSAGVSSPGRGATQLAIVPGVVSYTFRFGNPVTNDATRVTVFVVCRKIVPRIFKITLKTKWKAALVKSPVVIVPPKATKTVKLPCPGGQAPTGYGTDETNTSPKFAPATFAQRETLDLMRAMPVHGGWSFTLENTWPDTPKSARVFGVCHARSARAGGKRFRVEITRSTFHERPSSGDNRYGARCPRGRTTVGTGFSLPRNGAATAPATRVRAHDAQWSVEGFADPPPAVDLFLLCMRARES